MSQIRRGSLLRKAEGTEAAAPAPPAAEDEAAGGLAASLAQIRKGSARLKPVQSAKMPPLTRQQSDSLASVLRRRIAERKAAIGDDGDEDGDEDEWS